MAVAARTRRFSVRARTIVGLLASVLLGSCSDQPPVIPSVPVRPASAPSFVISDAVHTAGNPHFYFLPPMVAQPRYSGTFDQSVTPKVAVVICALASSSCGSTIASYTVSSGPGTDRVKPDTGAQQYVVNWRTDQFPLDLSKTYRITTLVAGTALGFADVVLLNNGSAKNTISGDLIALVDGRTLPIKLRIERGAVLVVTAAAGGTGTLADGNVTLAFPPSAVSADIGVTATSQPVGTGGSDRSVLSGTLYEFAPSPTTFAAPVTLSLKYPLALPATVKPDRLAACKLVDGACVPIVPSHVDALSRTVTAQINTFSDYGVTPFPEMVWAPQGGGLLLHTAGGEVQLPSPVQPCWNAPYVSSPDGSQFVYATATCGPGPKSLRAVNADGMTDRQLVGLPEVGLPDEGAFGCPQWFPDGNKILFTSANRLAVVNADGSGLQFLTPEAPSLADDRFGRNICDYASSDNHTLPTVGHKISTDGRTIVFRSSYEIWVVNADGSNSHLLIPAATVFGADGDIVGRRYFTSFGWSPDGTKLALYAPSIGSAAPGIYVANADGSNLRRLVSADCMAPVHAISDDPSGLAYYGWSPVIGDNRIIFGVLGDASSCGIPLASGICTLDVSTGKALLIMGAQPGMNFGWPLGPPPPEVTDPHNLQFPSQVLWSPDGSRISVEWTNQELWIINTNGSGGSVPLLPLGPFRRPLAKLEVMQTAGISRR